MKKLLLGLGAATSVIAPIAAVVACGDTKVPSMKDHKVITGAELTKLAGIVKTQTGIEFQTENNAHIVTSFSATTTGVVIITLVGDLKTALTATDNGADAATGEKGILKVKMTSTDPNDATKYTTAITINGSALKKGTAPLTGDQLNAIGAMILSTMNEDGLGDTHESTVTRITDSFAMIAADKASVGSSMSGSIAISEVNAAEQKVLLDKILVTLAAAEATVKTMTISYTDMETGTSTAVAAGTELTNLNAAILAYTAKISTPAARTSELETLKTTLNAAFATIFS